MSFGNNNSQHRSDAARNSRRLVGPIRGVEMQGYSTAGFSTATVYPAATALLQELGQEQARNLG